MTYYFSKSTNGFYVDDIHLPHQIPEDAVKITEEQYNSLFYNQSLGMAITSDENGYPINVENTPNPEILVTKQKLQEDRASALAKLAVLGLSEEEILALLK